MPSQSDNAIQFSFDSPNALPAEADLRAAVNVSDNPDHEAPAVADKATLDTQAEKTTQDVAQPDAKADAQVEDKSAQTTEDLKTYTIKVNGEEMTVTEADLKAGHMRHRDYTQKTQQLAEQQRSWEAREAQLLAQQQEIDSFLRNKAAVAEYAQRAFGIDLTEQATPPPQIDTTQPLSIHDVAKIAAYNAEQVRLSMARDFEAKLQANAEASKQAARDVQDGITREKLASEINIHMSGLLEKYPMLKKFEDITDDLYGDASKRLPRGASIADAKAQITAAAERRIAVIQSIAGEEKKTSAIAAAKLRNTSTEPLGGAAATKREQRTLTLNHRDQKDFRAAALADVQAFVDANS